MFGKVWHTARAGLFLLFVVVLAVLGPADAAVAGQATCSAATQEQQQDSKEHRDGEKLRDRAVKLAAVTRRQSARTENSRPLPAFLQVRSEFTASEPVFPNSGTPTRHEHLRVTHSPAMLQVVRH